MAYQWQEMQDRTKRFVIEVVRLCRTLPKTEESRIIGRQLLKSGTSVAANYRAVCRARSRAEFVAKIGVVLEEADETTFWLEMVGDLKLSTPAALLKELVAVIAASLRTAKSSLNQ